MTGRCEYRLGDVTNLNWGDTKTTKKSYTHVGFPAYSATGQDGFLPYHDFDCTGVVLSAIGANCGRTWLAKGKWSCIKNTIRFWSTSPKANTEYLYWLTREPDFWPKRGSAQPFISQGDAWAIRVSLPPIREQEAIARLLTTLNNKIEMNRRMNETLEAMARAIFKDWFVDFGSTRAKAEGRAPYLAPEIWDLFPDALDDDDKPVGWQLCHLADIAESPRRGISPANVSEDTPYIGLEHMPRRSIALTEWEGAGKVTSNKSILDKGDFLFGKLRPYFHKVGIAPLSGICSTDIVVLTPKTPDLSTFVLACISTDEFVTYTDQTSTGTKMPRTSWKIMGQYELCLPTESALRSFQNSVQPMINRIIANIHESRTLAQTRDLLLPKLMSGEIRLRETETAVEAVA